MLSAPVREPPTASSRASVRTRPSLNATPRVWTGAAWGLLIAAVPVMLISGVSMLWPSGPFSFTVATIVLLLVLVITAGLAVLTDRLMRSIPPFYKAAVAVTFTVVMTGFFLLPQAVIWVLLILLVSSALIGGATAALIRGSRGRLISATLIACVFIIASFATWLVGDGQAVPPPVNAAAVSGAAVTPLALPDPSQPGAYPVRTLIYGSGHDQHRPEFSTGVDLATRSVDGSALVNGWSMIRRAYWGFGPEALPLNGRVWYPAGSGPFPLVLIVHGNHAMEEDSDTGYAYLGELLASRGFIVASVDENFFDYSLAADLLMFTALQNENGARGWLLLEHLATWRTWNLDQTPGNPFTGKVDLDHVALIGHSRGGEAVAVAAAFNPLAFDPDDANVAFHFGFGIRSVVAIAPIDKLYQPAGRPTPLRDVNYLVLHSSHDMQAPMFFGAEQYERVGFTGSRSSPFNFKAGLYFYGGNHGQFNTAWGRQDNPIPAGWLYNIGQLISADEQRQIARVYIAGFLETTLHNQLGYLPLFRDHRTAPGWLPDTIMLHQYADSNTRLVVNNNDLDVRTTAIPGGQIQGQNLTVWRIGTVPTRLKRLPWAAHETSGVFLGWDAGVAANGTPASFGITLPPNPLNLTREDALVFSLSAADTTAQDPIDFSVELEDASGAAARLPLSHIALLQPQIQAPLMKVPFLESSPTSEVVFQTYSFSLSDFAAVNPEFKPSNLTNVRFVFDRTPAAVVVLEDLGFRAPVGQSIQ